MEGVTFRPAGVQDLAGIQTMGDVYSGLDEHVVFMSKYLQTPRYRCFVMEKYGKIIGFQMRIFLDENVVVKAAERIHMDYRGLGLSKVFHNYVESRIDTSCHPITLRKIYKTYRNDFSMTRAKRSGYTVIPDFEICMSFTSTAKEVFNMAEKNIHLGGDEITAASMEQVMNIMKCEEIKTQLFPSGYATVLWIPYTCSEENVKIIMERSASFVSTKEGKPFALSFVTIVKCQAAYKLTTDVYSDVSVAGPETLLTHAFNGIQCLRTMNLDDAAVVHPQVYYNQKVDGKYLRDVFATCSKEEIPSPYEQMTVEYK